MGDFNYDLLSNDDINVWSFVDTFFEHSFYPLINIPTRITDNTGKALDHFWTNIVEMPVQSAVLVDSISDHLPIFLNLCTNENCEKVIYNQRCFSEEAQRKFNKSLRKMKTHDILQNFNTNSSYSLFIERYMSIFESSFPVKKRKRVIKLKRNKPWYNNELKDLSSIKQKSYLLHISNKNNAFLKSKYNYIKNVYFRKVKSAKKEYYQKHLIAVRNDIKGTWKVINSVLGRDKT